MDKEFWGLLLIVSQCKLRRLLGGGLLRLWMSILGMTLIAKKNVITCDKGVGGLIVSILAAFGGAVVETQVEESSPINIIRCKFTSAPLVALNITINTESLGQATKLFESFSTYLKRWGILIVSNTQRLVTEKGGVCYLLAYGEKGCSLTLIRNDPWIFN